MKDKKKLSLWELYLTKEIGIEFKSCLYFFAFLFFYCVYRVCLGIYDASILHMTELIFTCYINWFAKDLLVTLLFAAYILLVYFCVYLIYKYKRKIDDKKLNEDLKFFQTSHQKSE